MFEAAKKEPYLDLYLMDIKHINSAKHKEFTTRDNDLILENAKKLANAAKEKAESAKAVAKRCLLIV